MQILISFLFYGLSVYLTDWLLMGVHVDNYKSALIVAVVLYLVYKIVKPLFVFLTLPVTFITLGIFYIFINAFMISLVEWMLPSLFSIDGFGWAFLMGLILYLLNGFFDEILSSYFENYSKHP